jgi:hypothetical protein
VRWNEWKRRKQENWVGFIHLKSILISKTHFTPHHDTLILPSSSQQPFTQRSFVIICTAQQTGSHARSEPIKSKMSKQQRCLYARSDVEGPLPNLGEMRKMHSFTAVVSEMHNRSGVRGYFPIQEPQCRDAIGGEYWHPLTPTLQDLRLGEIKCD